MITSFADDATADIYNGLDTRRARKRLPRELWAVASRKLDQLNAARETRDLAAPPGNRLERLRGDLAGRWSIRVNDQYRVVFTFEDGNASAVFITDYH